MSLLISESIERNWFHNDESFMIVNGFWTVEDVTFGLTINQFISKLLLLIHTEKKK